MERRHFLAYAGAMIAVGSGCLGSGSHTGDVSNGPGVRNTDIRFTDIAADESSAFHFRRGRAEEAVERLRRLRSKKRVQRETVEEVPSTSAGDYGVLVFDYDNDGDLDIFVPNAEGRPHHLYRNRLAETGEFRFEEVAERAGVAAPDQTGLGVAAADTDNDGNMELVVLSPSGERHRFFDNNGDGTFDDISDRVDITSRDGRICSFGDIDNNGLVDLFIGTESGRMSGSSCEIPFDAAEQNRLFKNLGDNRFREISEISGVQNMDGVPDGGGTKTHGVAMVDVDRDGEIEILVGDDQCAVPREAAVPGEGGENYGMVHVLDNDGDGRFTDKMEEYALGEYSVLSNMGFAFGDFNYDGDLDWLTTAYGDYMSAFKHEGYIRSVESTQWFLQREDGSFRTPGVGRLVATPFGWGCAALDYDNDGVTDLVFHGGATHRPLFLGDNPGVLMKGLGHGSFAFDEAAATSSETDHCRRVVYGVAVGDLNGNGYPDIVSVSVEDVDEGSELRDPPVEFEGPLDRYAKYNVLYTREEGGDTVEFTGFTRTEGSMSVEINDGGNENGWVAVKPQGTVGLLPDGRVNRAGIGAVISCRPDGSDRWATVPVTAGSSFGSQHSLEKTFGLGSADAATVDVLWPGGTRNRLYDVERGERVTFPEIPYSYDADLDKPRYRDEVHEAVLTAVRVGAISDGEVDRFLSSAVRAFEEEG